MAYEFLSLKIKHTPFAKNDAKGVTHLFCAAGENDRQLGVWVIVEGSDPVQLIAPESIGMYSVCSPWIDVQAGKYCLYATVTKGEYEHYSIAKFSSDTLGGPYKLETKDIVDGWFRTYDSPCIVGDTLYCCGVRDSQKPNSLFVMDKYALQPKEVVLPPIEGTRRGLVMKPNVFRVGPNQLAMFILEIEYLTNRYWTSVWSKKDEGDWEYVGEFKVRDDNLYYKPFLFKGYLVVAGRSFDFSQSLTWLDVQGVRLSEIWSGFTDWTESYVFPAIDMG